MRARLEGQRFGRLVVLSKEVRGPYIKSRWLCQCDCGNTSLATTTDLQRGRHQSCGCLQKERATKHGALVDARKGKRDPTYLSWQAMKDRCLNTKRRYYHRYGGRGITICDRWLHSFSAFLEDMGPRPTGLTLERINNDGNYEPSNCRWATQHEQTLNQVHVNGGPPSTRDAQGRFRSDL